MTSPPRPAAERVVAFLESMDRAGVPDEYDVLALSCVSHGDLTKGDLRALLSRIQELRELAIPAYYGRGRDAILGYLVDWPDERGGGDAGQHGYFCGRTEALDWAELHPGSTITALVAYTDTPPPPPSPAAVPAGPALDYIRCINWPCALPKDHKGPCSTSEPEPAPAEPGAGGIKFRVHVQIFEGEKAVLFGLWHGSSSVLNGWIDPDESTAIVSALRAAGLIEE